VQHPWSLQPFRRRAVRVEKDQKTTEGLGFFYECKVYSLDHYNNNKYWGLCVYNVSKWLHRASSHFDGDGQTFLNHSPNRLFTSTATISLGL